MGTSPGARRAARTRWIRSDRMDAAPSTTEERDGRRRDELIRNYVRLRRQAEHAVRLDAVRAAAADAANLEYGDGGTMRGYERVPAGSMWRSRRVWEGLSEADYRSGDGMVSRAHDALDAMSDDVVPRDRRQMLAELFDDPRERQAASALFVASSSPEYYSAYRAMMSDPLTGYRLWDDRERQAWQNASEAMRTAGSIRTASLACSRRGFISSISTDRSSRRVMPKCLTSIGKPTPRPLHCLAT